MYVSANVFFYFFAGRIQQPVARMHLPHLSSTGGLACGSSPFNDDLSPVANSSFHPHCMPGSLHRPYLHSALSDTSWPVVQPVFMPVDTNQIRFQSRCHHHPSPCHMSVCSCCDHLSPYGCSTFAKRSRLEGGRQLIPIETGVPSHVINVRAQNSHVDPKLPLRSPKTRRPPDSPPPLVKISPTIIHKKTPGTHSIPETRKTLHSRGSSVIATRNVESVQRHDSLKDRINSSGAYSIALRDFSSTLRKIGPHSLPKNYSKLSKFDTESVPESKSKTNCKKFKKDEVECEQCHTSAHHENPKDEFVPPHQAEIDYIENHDRCFELKMGPNETIKHFLSTKVGEDTQDFNQTRNEELQQNYRKRSLAKYREQFYVACECSQTYQPYRYDGNLERNQLVQRIPVKTTRRKSVIRHHQTTIPTSSDQKEEPQVNATRKCYCYESSNPEYQEFKERPVVSPTERVICNTEFSNHLECDQKFIFKAVNKIGRCYPISREDSHQKFDDASNKSEALYSRLPESNVPQLRRGRPRTRGIKDKGPIYDGSLTFGTFNNQSRLKVITSGDIPKLNRNREDPYDEVFYEPACADMNNNDTVAADDSRYRSAASENHSNTNTRLLINGHQTRKKFTFLGQTKQEMYAKEPLDGNTNAKIASSREYSNEYGPQRRGSLTHYHEASGDNCQKSPSALNDQTYYVSVSRPGIKRSPSTPCYGSSRFVMSLNDLLKRRTKSAEELYRTKSFPFYSKQRQDNLQFENSPNEAHNSHSKEEIEEVTKANGRWGSKAPEKNRSAENFHCSVDQSDVMEFGKKEPKALHTSGTKEETRLPSTIRLPTTKREQVKCHDFKAKATNSQENKVSIDVGKRCQSPDSSMLPTDCPMSEAVPPSPTEEETNGMNESCGGYAIDHSFLPKIVAVHSIANRDDTPQKSDPKIFSENNKKYWNDLLKKLTFEISNDYEDTQSLKEPIERTPASHHKRNSCSSLLEESKVHDSQYESSPKDGVAFLRNVDSSNLCGVKMNNGSAQRNMDHCHVSSSQNLTLQVPSPLPIVESEAKKTSLPRKKQTVAELSQKILTTRERIKQETIAWKKKLLYSLEAIFIKKLRKLEKETGEKAEISIEEAMTKEESKEKKNGTKEKRQIHGEKEKISEPCYKQTTKKKL